jgi:TetR/AcrR family fatty acid metabolism transcriptional regulator
MKIERMKPEHEKRERILLAGISIFAEKGYQETKISEIAERADIANGTIYEYFKNKEDLLFSTPEVKNKEFCEQLELHLRGIDGAFNKFRKYIWWWLYFSEEYPDYAKILLMELRPQKKFRQHPAYQKVKQATDILLQIIEEGKEEGSIQKNLDSYLVRHLLMGMVEHTITRWLVKDKGYSLVQYTNAITDLVMKAVKEDKT